MIGNVGSSCRGAGTTTTTETTTRYLCRCVEEEEQVDEQDNNRRKDGGNNAARCVRIVRVRVGVDGVVDASSTPAPRTVQQLEELLEGCLRVQQAQQRQDGDAAVANADNESAAAAGGAAPAALPNVLYAARSEASLLKCRRTRRRPLASLLGLLEEADAADDAAQEDVVPPIPLRTNVWCADTKATTEPSYCRRAGWAVPPPHREWKRTDGVASAATHATQNSQGPPGAVVDWVDLRSVASNTAAAVSSSSSSSSSDDIVSTPGGACHFLRSLLPNGDDDGSVSPWTNRSRCNETGDEGSSADGANRVVVLCLAGDSPPQALLDFRVADACPSWYLFSVCLVSLWGATGEAGGMQQQQQQLFLAPWCAAGTLTETQSQQYSKQNATLFVYRCLPPRPHLSLCHPTTRQLAPLPGCLWETVVLKPKDGEAEKEESTEGEVVTRLVSPPYCSAQQEYPQLLEPLLENLHVLQREALQIGHWTAWPEEQHYSSPPTADGVAAWTVFPLCYCFPASDVSQRKWVDATCQFVPDTVALLKRHLGDTLRTALLSRLQPRATLEAHTGWQDLANHVLRIHIPLVVPDGGLCGTWVDGCVETHATGRLLCMDDSKTHWAFNYSEHQRIVLIVDLARPATLPMGTAVGGHSDELDSFIQQMSAKTNGSNGHS